ncbi:MAG: YheV family putative zinc ribbon protein [Gammaproteobacteria bacterium]
MMNDNVSSALPKPRFIANAICPQCQKQDTIRLWTQPEAYIECIGCDFKQTKSYLESLK